MILYLFPNQSYDYRFFLIPQWYLSISLNSLDEKKVVNDHVSYQK